MTEQSFRYINIREIYGSNVNPETANTEVFLLFHRTSDKTLP
jgi:hypothetical protein